MIAAISAITTMDTLKWLIISLAASAILCATLWSLKTGNQYSSDRITHISVSGTISIPLLIFLVDFVNLFLGLSRSWKIFKLQFNSILFFISIKIINQKSESLKSIISRAFENNAPPPLWKRKTVQIQVVSVLKGIPMWTWAVLF